MARVSAGGRLAFLGGCGGLWLLQREWLASGLLPGTGLIPRRTARACSPWLPRQPLLAPWSVETLGSAGERGTKVFAVSLVGTLDEVGCQAELES